MPRAPHPRSLRRLSAFQLLCTALAVALREGRLAPDGPAPDDPSLAATLALTRRDDVIATPHNAFNTAEALARKAAQSVESVVAFLRDGTFLNPVPLRGSKRVAGT